MVYNLLNNKHFVRITLNPSKQLADEELKEEKERLERIHKTLSEKQIKTIITLHDDLKKLQESDPSENIDLLPKISLQDVPKNPRSLPELLCAG